MRAMTLLSLFGLVMAPIAMGGPTPRVSVNKEGVILSGYDAVAYFTEEKAVKGKERYSAEYEGATYLFSSAKNRGLFAKNPKKYAPQFGGWCAYGAALGKKFPVDGKAFDVVDGKLYVNLDKKIKKKWAEDRDGFIKKADMKWLEIKDTPADEL